MRLQTFVKRTRMPVPAGRLCTWHASPRALEVLIPPGEPLRLTRRTGGIEDGAVTVFAIGYGSFCIQWVAVHCDYIPGRQFRDVQEKGPFAHWVHTHRFETDGAEASYLEDHVEYALPLAWLTQPIVGGLVRKRIQAMFDYRHAVTLREVVG